MVRPLADWDFGGRWGVTYDCWGFQQGNEDFVRGYVRPVVEVVVYREFFVNEVFFYGIEVGTLALVLQDSCVRLPTLPKKLNHVASSFTESKRASAGRRTSIS